MFSELPLVSVLLTAYNRQKYIGEAIESVVASSYTNFELIVVDDGSTDDTIEIIKSYIATDERIHLYVNEKNIGDYANRNKAAGFAKGKYLKYVDSDDALYHGGLEYCVQCMEENKEADWAIIYPLDIKKEFILQPREAIQSHFFEEPFLKAGPGLTIIKREFFLRLGMYPTKYGPASDMYFNLHAASKGNVLVLKDNFLFYRRHDAQEQSNQFVYLYNYNKYLKDAFENLQLPLTGKQINWLQKKRKRRFAVNITNYFFKTCNITRTKEAIQKADFTFKDFLTGIFHLDKHPGKYFLVNRVHK